MRDLATVILGLLIVLTVLCQSSCFQNSLDAEARKQAENLWNSTFAKCGDTYVGVSHGYYVKQLKNPEILVVRDPKPLSEADKLNSVEWKGVTGIRCSSYRYLGEDWEPCSGYYYDKSYYGEGVPMKKQKGKWEFDLPIEANRVIPYDCSKLPKS